MTTGGAGMTTGWDRLVWDSLEKPGGDEGERECMLDAPEDRLSSSYRRKPVSIPWIPAFAGMTMGGGNDDGRRRNDDGRRGYDDGRPV